MAKNRIGLKGIGFTLILGVGVFGGLIRCGSDTPAAAPTSTSTPSGLACDAGTFSADGESCADCVVGTYSSSTQYGVSACTDCSPGYFQSAEGSTSCIPCDVGYFAGSAASWVCTLCAPGTFSASSGSVSCDDCPANTYQAFAGGTSCLSCPMGTTSAPGSAACV